MPSQKTLPEANSLREIQRAIEQAQQHPSPTFMLNKPADQGESSTAWRDLLDREREHRRRIFEAFPDGGKQRHVAVRAWWGTVSEVLNGIQTVTDWDDVPYQLLEMLAGQAAYLAVGQIPDPIKHVGGKGRTAPGPGEISDIRWAVTYVCAAREGRVRGLKPPVDVRGHRKSSPEAVAIAVVRRLYKLRSEQTVREWCRTYQPFPHAEASPASYLRSRLVSAACRYRLNERTHDARTRADRKRQQENGV
jgi:hypothetical protein